MNTYQGQVKTKSGPRTVTVKARSFDEASQLLLREGKLLYRPKMIPG